jgi:predicted Zn finger-like uncharacterized protein
MSLITRCPACTTLFKVVPDQLRVSEGWVRCGQCDEVFDANAHLQGEGQAQAPVSSVPNTDTAAPESAQADTSAWESSDPVASSGVDTEPQMPVDAGPELEQELAAKLEWPDAPSSGYDPLMDVRPGAVFQPEPALHLEIPEDGQAPALETSEPVLPPMVEPAWDASVDASPPLAQQPPPVDMSEALDSATIDHLTPSAPSPLTSHAPAFMHKARPPSRWNSPWVRRSLAATSVVLFAGLVLQVALHERDRLAASVPALQPALTAMCQALDCQIAPFKQIDSVVIDASSFVKVRGDVYRLNLTLKNTSPIDLAAPAVELTLTDLQEQPLIRRVLSATELGAQQGRLVAGGELTTALPISVKTAGAAEHISGYRLLAFYP